MVCPQLGPQRVHDAHVTPTATHFGPCVCPADSVEGAIRGPAFERSARQDVKSRLAAQAPR